MRVCEGVLGSVGESLTKEITVAGLQSIIEPPNADPIPTILTAVTAADLLNRPT